MAKPLSVRFPSPDFHSKFSQQLHFILVALVHPLIGRYFVGDHLHDVVIHRWLAPDHMLPRRVNWTKATVRDIMAGHLDPLLHQHAGHRDLATPARQEEWRPALRVANVNVNAFKVNEVRHHCHVPSKNRVVEGGHAALVDDVDRHLLRHEEFDDLKVAPRCGRDKHRPSVRPHDVAVSVVDNQKAHNLVLAMVRCVVQRGTTKMVLKVHVNIALLSQQFDDCVKALGTREHERSDLVIIGPVDVAAMHEKELAHGEVVLFGGNGQVGRLVHDLVPPPAPYGPLRGGQRHKGVHFHIL
mmetsp:Transcript_12333/g.33411  ORF Transcript_12333/g.33411 Transcript_12333/m.33411 type:complete len:298 (-) Transcript_12333:313-1206(-)